MIDLQPAVVPVRRGRPPRKDIEGIERTKNRFDVLEDRDTSRPEPVPENRQEIVFDTTTKADLSVSRFMYEDLLTIGPWLATRLRMDRRPDLSDRMVIGWLRGCMDNNLFCLLKNENAVGLAQITYDPLDPRPVLEELFVYTKDGCEADGLPILDRFIEWGKQMQAFRVVFGGESDVPGQMIEERYGRTKQRVSHYLPLK